MEYSAPSTKEDDSNWLMDIVAARNGQPHVLPMRQIHVHGDGNSNRANEATQDERFIMKVVSERLERQQLPCGQGATCHDEAHPAKQRGESAGNSLGLALAPHMIGVGIWHERTMSQPGAYAEPGIRCTFMVEALSSSPISDDDESAQASCIDTDTDTETAVDSSGTSGSGLAVAELVEHSMGPQGLQLAQPYIEEEKRKTQIPQVKKLPTILCVGAMLWAAVAVPAVTIWVSKSKGSVIKSMEEPLVVPSEAPAISPEVYILSLLDERTIISLEDPDSPQSKAYQWLIQDFVPSYLDDRIKQRFALATLFFSAGGDEWDDNTHWLNHTVHECDWFNSPDFARKAELSKLYPGSYAGFLEPLPSSQCSDDGFYQHLWLDQNNLLGSLPEELYMLTSLQTISMGWNQLGGTISNNVGKLTALEGLFLQRMHLSGTIPTGISLLPNLVVLGLSSNNLEGDIPSDFWKLANLRDVSLRRLHLKGTISTEIGALSKLREFLVAESGLSGTIPTEVGHLKALESLGLYNSRFSGSLPSELGQLKVLSGFRFNHNLFNGTLPTELGLATSLVNIVGQENQFSGQIPSEFGLLSNPDMIIDFQDNFLTGTIPTELGQTKVKDLEFQNNQISGQIPSEFGELSSLGFLNLANNLLSGTLPEELSFLQQSLYGIALEGNQLLSGSIPASLCTLNGTCSNGGWDPCRAGLSFDCSATGMLCGCGCSCLDRPGH
ncbi:Leucine Rich Repeat [Seminavis robusta]|uniref:Leucine Rich Repeat n=1 Tax=Seminavis robusta TaxID=568900 RepID=A0A9N8HFC7_9STRA|nr:Leucine Rich Repeat [Seminavis robusta]|eukprot:Sro449_g145320.1 Leucine Rich Repeat (723) ;mRNA; f:33235-35485